MAAAILTDSGGFQVFSLDTLRKVTDARRPFSVPSERRFRTFLLPQSTVDVQLALGSDIIMVLDECLAYPATHKAALDSMQADDSLGANGVSNTTGGEKRAGTARYSRSCRAPCSPICARTVRNELLELDARVTPSAGSQSVSLAN